MGQNKYTAERLFLSLFVTSIHTAFKSPLMDLVLSFSSNSLHHRPRALSSGVYNELAGRCSVYVNTVYDSTVVESDPNYSYSFTRMATR